MESRVTAFRSLFAVIGNFKAQFRMAHGLAVVCAVVFVGCSGKEPVRRYTIERETTASNDETRDDRMLVGIAINESQAWFLKLVGARTSVDQREAEFSEFLKTISFTGSLAGAPRWQTPTSWRRKPGTAFRYATIEIPGDDPPLEISISTLSIDGDLDSYLRANIDRWRREMGLGPMPRGEPAADSMETIEGSEESIMLLKLAGAYNGGARGAMNAPPTAPPSAPPPPADRPQYVIPDGWTEGRQTRFSAISLVYSDDSGSAVITISDLAAAANTWQDNVVRWTGIVQIPQITPELIDQHTKSIEIDGITGNRIDLPWPGATGNGQALSGIMLVDGPIAWFIRFSGDAQTIEQQSASFEAFIESLKFGTEANDGQ